jgi:hypothetical protein
MTDWLVCQLSVLKCGTFEVHGSYGQGDKGEKHCRVRWHLSVEEREKE